MTQRYYTYVLKSERDEHLYIGFTSDLKKRVNEHNKGKVRSTKSRRPLSLVFYEEHEDKTLGRKREIFLKSGQGRIYLKNRLKELSRGAVSPAEGESTYGGHAEGRSVCGGKNRCAGKELRVRISASPPLPLGNGSEGSTLLTLPERSQRAEV